MTGLDTRNIQTGYVLPFKDSKARNWPERSASMAVNVLFKSEPSELEGIDYLFYMPGGKAYGVCVETMTIPKRGENGNVIVPLYRLAKKEVPCKKVILAVFAKKDIRGLDCRIAGWLPESEVRKWEAPADKTMFKRKGKRFAIIPRERLKNVTSLVQMSEQWRCVI